MRACRGFSSEPIWTGPPPPAPIGLLIVAALLFMLALVMTFTHR